MSYATFAEELRKWWSFDDRQVHTHSWHSREDFIKDKMCELIDAETKPLHADIDKLKAVLATATDTLSQFANAVAGGDRGWIQFPVSECHRAGDAMDRCKEALTSLKAQQ
jgi:hypothetical protein